MITKLQAETSKHYQEFYFIDNEKVKRARVNGKCKTWKTRPDHFKIPMKFGLYDCFYITQDNCQHWFFSQEEAESHLPPKISGRIDTKANRARLENLLTIGG